MKCVVTKRETVGGGINWEDGINEYTPLQTKQKTIRKDPVHSTGRPTQCRIKPYVGKGNGYVSTYN